MSNKAERSDTKLLHTFNKLIYFYFLNHPFNENKL